MVKNTRGAFFRMSETFWVFLIITLAIMIRIPLLMTPLTFSIDYWRQADTASIAHHFLVNGMNIFYPQIYWGGNGPGYVETEFQLYTFLVSLLYWIFGEHLWLGRLVSLSFSIATMILFYLFARRLIGQNVAIWSLIFFVVSPLYLRYSIAYMPEATVMFFYVAALYFFDEWMEDQKLSLLIWTSIMISLAILVKPTSINIGMVFALLAFHKYGKALFKRKDIWLTGLLSLLPGALWFSHARNLYLEYGNTFGLLSGGDSKFGSIHDWLNPYFYYAVTKLEIKWVFGGFGVILFLLGLALSIRKRRPLVLVYGILTLIIYYMIVGRYSQVSWGIQYHVYAIPYASLGAGIGIDWLIVHTKEHLRTVITALLLIAILAGSAYLYGDMLDPDTYIIGNKLTECGINVKKIVPAEARIIVSSTDVSEIKERSIPNNYQDPAVFFYADRYGWSLPSDWHTPKSLDNLRQSGGKYFVISSADLYHSNPDLIQYLNTSAEQIGPGIESGCGIYLFNK